MSDFGEAIIKRLNNNELQKTTNPMNQVINNAIGGWLTEFDEQEFFEQFFLQEAQGNYLDLHGRDYGIKRKIDESDEDYRKRIIYESLGQLTVGLLESVYNVNLYCHISNFDATSNTLTSQNPYLAANYGFMGVADTITQNILNKKFILDSGVTWL